MYVLALFCHVWLCILPGFIHILRRTDLLFLQINRKTCILDEIRFNVIGFVVVGKTAPVLCIYLCHDIRNQCSMLFWSISALLQQRTYDPCISFYSNFNSWFFLPSYLAIICLASLEILYLVNLYFYFSTCVL